MVVDMMESKLEMTEEAWDAIEATVRQTLQTASVRDAVELAPRVPGHSATLARYNPDAHFLFQSPSAVNSLPPLDHALTACRLRRRPAFWLERDEQGENSWTQRPFEFGLNGSMDGFDVDGDVIAACGDRDHQNMRSNRPFLATTRVRRVLNLAAARTLADLRVATPDGDTISYDTERKLDMMLFREGNRGRKFFTECVADAVHERVWAVSCSTNTVHGFTTVCGVKRKERGIGLLAFGSDEILGQKDRFHPRFSLSRCGDDLLIGTACANHLSVWKISEALQQSPQSAFEKEPQDVAHESSSDDGVEYEEEDV